MCADMSVGGCTCVCSYIVCVNMNEHVCVCSMCVFMCTRCVHVHVCVPRTILTTFLRYLFLSVSSFLFPSFLFFVFFWIQGHMLTQHTLYRLSSLFSLCFAFVCLLIRFSIRLNDNKLKFSRKHDKSSHIFRTHFSMIMKSLSKVMVKKGQNLGLGFPSQNPG